MRLHSIILAVVLSGAAIGCTSMEGDTDQSQTDEIGAVPQVSSFVLTISGIETEDVISPGRDDTCPGGTCNFAYIGGTALTITATGSRADCLQFAAWKGACAGQGATCSLVINSNLSVGTQWGRIAGCVPQ